MDAAQTNSKKFSFLFATAALLLTAPIHASAATLGATANAVTLGSSDCNDRPTINVTSSGGGAAPISFTVGVNYLNGTSNGDANGAWIYATIANSGTTSTGATFQASTGTTDAGANMTIGLNRSLGANPDTGQVVITEVGNPSDTITITVYYSQNTSCGSNTGVAGNGFVSATPGNISLTASTSGQQSQNLTIQNTTGTGMTFGYSVSPSGSWLSATANTTVISANGTVPLTVTADATKTAGPNSYNGILTITPQSGFGAPFTVPVVFVVTNGSSSGGGGGVNTGTLTINGPSATSFTTTFNYVQPTAPGGTCVNIQDSSPGASSYSWQVSTSGGGNWLLANGSASGTTPQFLSAQNNACVNLTLSNVIGTLQSGAYQGSVLLTSSSGSQATINVNLYVSAGVAPGVTVTPGAIFNFLNVLPNSNVIQQQVIQVTAAPGYVLGIASLNNGASGFSMSAPTASNNTETFTITSNSTGLITGVYSTTVTITSTLNNSTNTTTITIVLPVGQGGTTTSGNGGGTGTTLWAPTALTFQQQQGSGFWTGGQEAQKVIVTGVQGTQWSTSIVYAAGASNWLNLDSGTSSGTFGSGPATLLVDLFNGVSALAPSSTPYQATLNITTTNGTYPVAVSLIVTAASAPVLLGIPASVVFNATTGTNVPTQNVQIVGSDNTSSASNPPLTAGTPTASWLSATTSGNTMTISASAGAQGTGVYSATIPVTASAYANPINYPVILVVNGGGSGGTTSSGPLTLSSSSLSFNNVTTQVSQNLNVTASSVTNFTASASETSCTNQSWLSIANGSNFTATSNNTNVLVAVNPSGIANGSTCSGVVNLATSSATQVVGVTMTVGTTTGGGNVTVSPTSLTFNYTQNQAVPAVQNVTIINSTSGTASIPFTVNTAEATGNSVNWLQTSATSGNTPANSPGLGVNVAPGNLNAGQYTGTVTITPNGGTAQVVNVSLNINSNAVVTATPTTLSMGYTVGQTAPTATVQVSAGGAAAGFTATASSSGGWLAVSPTAGTTPNTGTFNLSVSTVSTALTSLLPSGTPYTGTITVTGTSPATGTTIINVSLTVSAPLPSISAVINAASGAPGAVSPGELISIFAPASGANPIGPATAVKLDSTTCPSPCTSVPKSMGGVTVTFLPSGFTAPLLYVSSNQINAVVPYEVANTGGLSVEIKYLGQTSNAFPVGLAATAPGLFTTNGGVGLAASYQLDPQGNFSYNTSATPAKVGWTIVLYITGEGVVSPAAATGSVTVAKNTNPPVPVPASAPTVLINNQPATVSGYGEAPGVVSGVLQVNVVVPAGAGTGPQPIVISLGNQSTQVGATVSLQ